MTIVYRIKKWLVYSYSDNTVVNWRNINVRETFIGRRIMQRQTVIPSRNLAAVTGRRFPARPLRTMVRFHLPLSLLILPFPCPTAGVKQINVAVAGVNDKMQRTWLSWQDNRCFDIYHIFLFKILAILSINWFTTLLNYYSVKYNNKLVLIGFILHY